MALTAPDISFVQLRYFTAVVEEGGFHAAAERLGRTQPALSQAIRSLEEQLGGPLFQRNTRAMLTPFGRSFYPMARDVVETSARSFTTARRLAAGYQGTVRLATGPMARNTDLAEVIADFASQRPKVQLCQNDCDDGTCRELILSGRIDFAVASVTQVPSDLALAAVRPDPLGIVCHPDHPLARDRGPVGPAELVDFHIVASWIAPEVADLRLRALLLEAGQRLDTSRAARAAAARGQGVAVLPSLAVPAEARDIVFRPVAEPDGNRRLGLLTRRGTTLSPASRELYDRVADALAGTVAAASA